jgi:3-phenylpropionate/trans-cinnamate dioxygenase ferredoxin reductase subunit
LTRLKADASEKRAVSGVEGRLQMTRTIAIVGAGHAGVQAAASLREEGFDGRIALIGEERDLPYHKPPLSKTFIKDAQARPQVLRAESFYAQQGIDLLFGETVDRLDPVGRRLVFGNGSTLGFDAAILATGARPRPLPLEGGAVSGLVALRTLADAALIRDLAPQAGNVVIIGGGFIGLEIAATLAALGSRITVVEAQDRLLARVVAPAVSAHVAARLRGLGIRVLTGVTVSGLESAAGRVEAVLLSSGERLPADMAVVGIGVLPNQELAAAAGIATGNGIRVDAGMRSSVPEILAIGDVASYRHFMTGADARLESVQNATDQARLAARTLTGRDESYAAVPWFWSDIGDMKLQMVGLTGGGDRHVLLGDPAENKFSVVHFLGDRFLGIESVNRPADHMLGRRMLGEGFAPDFSLFQAGPEAVKAAYDAFKAGKASSTAP